MSDHILVLKSKQLVACYVATEDQSTNAKIREFVNWGAQGCRLDDFRGWARSAEQVERPAGALRLAALSSSEQERVWTAAPDMPASQQPQCCDPAAAGEHVPVLFVLMAIQEFVTGHHTCYVQDSEIISMGPLA